MNCEKCASKVYSADPKVEIHGKAYHKSCFKCAEPNCKVLLSVQNYVTSNGVLYCSKHAPKLKAVTGNLPQHSKDLVASARAEELRKEAIDFGALKGQLKKPDGSQASRSSENLPATVAATTLPTETNVVENEVATELATEYVQKPDAAEAAVDAEPAYEETSVASNEQITTEDIAAITGAV